MGFPQYLFPLKGTLRAFERAAPNVKWDLALAGLLFRN